MKRLLFLPLFISISIINSGFIFKGNVKGVVCGDKNFFQTLKQDFIQKDLYKQANEKRARLAITGISRNRNFLPKLYPNFLLIDSRSNIEG